MNETQCTETIETITNNIEVRFREQNKQQEYLLNEIEIRLSNIYYLDILNTPDEEQTKETTNFIDRIDIELQELKIHNNRLDNILKSLVQFVK